MKAKIKTIIQDLERCATQNEKDAKNSGGWCHLDCAQSAAVASEQRRIIKILSGLRRDA